MSPFAQEAYDAATAAILKLIQQEVTEIMPQIPFMFRGMVPVDKEPAAAAALAKTALDAAAPHVVATAYPKPHPPQQTME